MPLYDRGFKMIAGLLSAVLAISFLLDALSAENASAQILRIGTYNMSDRPANATDDQNLRSILIEIGNVNLFGNMQDLDLLGFQEGPSSSNAYSFVEQDFEAVYEGSYSYALSNPDPAGDRTGYVFNVNTLQLLDAVNLSSGLTHNILRGHFRPIGGKANDEFYVYSIHLKAGITDRQTREAEAIILRNNADALPVGSNIIFMGDFNIRGSDEGGWIKFVSPGGPGQAFDSINTPFGLRANSIWNNSLPLQPFHTQNPVDDMDDRFDVQIFSANCFDSDGFDYVKGSITVIGNNGTHVLGGNLTSSDLPGGLVNSLIDFSDHLPVIADYNFGLPPTVYNREFDVSAFDNKTVQPSGPRPGQAGMDFFNVEGDDNGDFASFGVLDFDLSGLVSAGESATGVDNVTLKLGQLNAGFTTNGPISIYLASPAATSVTIDSSIQYQVGNNKLDCVPAILANGAELIGVYAYFGRDMNGATLPDGTLDQIALNGITLQQAVMESVNGNRLVRLIVTPDQGATAATFAGYSNVSIDGPALTADYATVIDSVPLEPESFSVIRGLLAGGKLEDVLESDNSYLTFNPGITLNSNEPPVWIQFDATAPSSEPSAINLTVEAGLNTSGLLQDVEMFSFTSGQWETVDSRTAQTTDVVVSVNLNGDLSRFIDSVTHSIRVRTRWKVFGPVLLYPWTVRIDQVVWTITP